MQDYVGKQIDRYRITERLGMGGMAVVYKAYDTRLERDVALKLIRTESIPQDQHERLFKRFEREAKAQARFSHRNIVPVHDYGEVEGSPYLVMAYIAGGTLKEHLKQGPMGWQQAVQLLIPVAEALNYAHQRGVIHRDVKPGNILFDEEGQPILTDFGIAKVLETDEATLTGTGMGVGTPEYMAPEQWQGKASEATDQYALGVVFYELITGKKPYQADTPAAIAILQATEPLAPPSKLVSGVPKAVEKVLYKALARNPEDRYENMEEFALALRGLLAEADTAEPNLSHKERRKPEPALAPQVSDTSESVTRDALDAAPVEELGPAIQGKWGLPGWALWAGGVLIGVVIIAIIIRIAGNMSKGDEEPLAMIAIETPIVGMTQLVSPTSYIDTNLENGSEVIDKKVISVNNFNDIGLLQILGNGRISEVAYSPDGKIVAVTSSIGIFLYDDKTMEEIRYINTDKPVYSISFSPDSKLIAVGSFQSGIIDIWNVTNGSLVKELSSDPYTVTSVKFSPDGQLLAVGHGFGQLQLWDVSTDTLLFNIEAHSDMIECLDFSPDGTLLASGSRDHSIKLWEIKNLTLLDTLVGHTYYVKDVAFSPDGEFLASVANDLRLWDVNSGKLRQSISSAHEYIDFSPDGQMLVTDRYEEGKYCIQLWNIANESSEITMCNQLGVHNYDVVFSSDGNSLISGSYDGIIRRWSVSDGALLSSFGGFTNDITGLAFSQDSKYLYVGYEDFIIKTIDLVNYDTEKILSGKFIWRSAFSSDGNFAASGYVDGRIDINEVDNGQLLWTSYLHADVIDDLTFSPNGRFLASSARDDTVCLWDLSEGNLVSTYLSSNECSSPISFDSDSNLLAFVDSDFDIQLIQISNTAKVGILEGHTDCISSLNFSTNGDLLASSSVDGSIRIWQVPDGNLIATFKQDSLSPYLSFSPDGNLLVSVSNDNTINLWDVNKGLLLRKFHGHTEYIQFLVFSPDGSMLASGSYDGTVRLWGFHANP